MRGLLSVPIAVGLAVAIHADWHLARPHDHGGLSFHWSYHWTLAIPVFALAAWYLARQSSRPALAGVLTIAVAAWLAQVIEPIGEYLAYGEPFSESFSATRVGVFAVYLTVGVATFALVIWLTRRRAGGP